MAIPPFGSPPTADATTTKKGKVQLAGDLGGTAALPTVPGLTSKQPLDADLTALAGLSGVEGDIIYRDATQWQRLAKGTALQQLRINAGATAPEWATSSGGQTLVTKIVASSGGDYTTLGAALAAASANWVIFIKDAVTEAGTITSSTAGISIVGLGSEASSVTLAGNVALTGANTKIFGVKFIGTTFEFSLIADPIEVYDCNFAFSSGHAVMRGTYGKVIGNRFTQSAASSTYGNILDCQGGKFGMRVENNHFQPFLVNGAEMVIFSGNNHVFAGNTFSIAGATGAGYLLKISSSATVVANNQLWNSTSSSNIRGITVPGSDCTIIGNYIEVANTNGILISGSSARIIGNKIITSAGSNVNGINLDASNCLVVGNELNGNNISAEVGINIYALRDDNTIANNRISGHVTGISIAASTCDRNIITGNSLNTGFTNKITDLGTGTVLANNGNVPVIQERRVSRMKNTSGATIAVGALVTLKSVATSDEITTTTAAGDNKVFGVAEESIANNASGAVCTRGKVTTLKVNGTTDIAIGDYLTSYTTVEIAAKATAGQTAIAIALEAYATDDSAGVIDALLINPRTI